MMMPSKMKTQTAMMLMNSSTGTVQSAEDWAADGYTADNAKLIEVVILDGDWVEA